MLAPSKVLFCHQTWQLETTIQFVDTHQNFCDVVVDSTPFHPVSHIWPDHPADKGTLATREQQYVVNECLVGAIELSSMTLYVDKAIPVKRDAEGWVFVVVHRLESEAELAVGQTVLLTVDKPYQQSLSRGHSAGHIASLALNKVLTESFWRKDADRIDGLGSYDFNSYAQELSVVSPECCFDRYRLGKTLKKRGLNTADVLANLNDIESRVNQQLAQWLVMPTDVEMKLEGPYLTSSRYWQCQLGGVNVVMPCGGTHINSTAEVSGMRIELQAIESMYIEMYTHVINQ